MSNRLLEIELYHLELPFRQPFAHALKRRESTETVVAAALLADGTVGFGEGLPRRYVTGETPASVMYNVGDALAGPLRGLEPKSFAELLEVVDNLPFRNEQGNLINAARCCVELALLDAYGRYFGSDLSSIVQWMGYGRFGGGGSLKGIRVSGVLGASRAEKTGRRLRAMRWYGLRDFKLKLGTKYDEENLALVERRLGRALCRERVTLRVDANGAWDIDTAVGMSERLAALGVCSLEQPLAPDDGSHWQALADLAEVPLMADESLLTYADGEFLAQHDLVDYFNIRLSKNGGLLPAIRLAEIATQYGKGYQLGAMVGETAILTAAGKRFLQMVPEVVFTEIGYSTFLLREDLGAESVRFGYRGRLSPPVGSGLGVEVRRECLGRFLLGSPRKLQLG